MGQIGTLNTFTEGTKIESAKVNENFAAIKTAVNANYTSALAVDAKVDNLNIINICDAPYNAKGDGTDESVIIQQALDDSEDGGTVYLGIPIPATSVTYSCNLEYPNKRVNIKGAGIDQVFLKSYTSTGVALVFGNVPGSTGGQWMKPVISDFSLMGDAGLTRTGIQFGHTVYEADDELAGRYVFKNMNFYQLDKGIAKLYGNIGNVYENCTFSKNNYDYWATSYGTAMHNGNDIFLNPQFDNYKKASIYINGIGGQHTFENPIWENGDGFALFVKNYTGLSTGLKINNPWFEMSYGSSAVDIEGTSYTPKGSIYLENTDKVIVNNSYFDGVELIDSHITYNDVAISNNGTTDPYVTKDADSTINWTGNIIVNDTNIVDGIVNGNIVATGNGSKVKCLPLPDFKEFVTGYQDNLYVSQTFGTADTYSWTGPITAYRKQGSPYGNYAELTIPANSSTYYAPVLNYYPTNKYVVTMASLRKISGSSTSYKLKLTGGTNIGAEFLNFGSTWKTYVGISKLATGGNAHAVFYNSDVTNAVTIGIANLQVLAFDTHEEAQAFIRSGKFVYLTKGEFGTSHHQGLGTFMPKSISTDTAAPTTGTWGIGDTANYRTVTSGGKSGSKCTAAGTLGTLSGVTGTITTGKPSLVVNDLTDLKGGMYITVATGITAAEILNCPTAIVSTNVSADSASGQKVINVTSTAGILANDYILIGQGTAREEGRTVDSVTSTTITVFTNLTYTHTASDADVVQTALLLGANASGTASGQAVSYSAPTFKEFGAID